MRAYLTVIFENDVLADVEGDLVSDNWPEPQPEVVINPIVDEEF